MRRRVDDVAWGVPVGISLKVSGPVLNGIPIDKPGQAGVHDEGAQVLIGALVIFDDGAGYHLVINLP
jgi:hypothetical protein